MSDPTSTDAADAAPPSLVVTPTAEQARALVGLAQHFAKVRELVKAHGAEAPTIVARYPVTAALLSELDR